MELLSCQDYREYLRYIYEERKKEKSYYSYRLMATSLGIDSSQLFRVLSGKLHLPTRFIDTIADNLKFNTSERKYFNALVHYGRSKKEKDIKYWVNILLEMRDIQLHTLENEQFKYFNEWYHPTVRALLAAGALKKNTATERAKLGAKVLPPISEAQVKDSIKLLEDLSLIYFDEPNNTWEMEHPHLSSPLGNSKLSTEIIQAIRRHQKEMLGKAQKAVDEFQPIHRDFSSLNFAIDVNALTDIKEILREARQNIQKRVDDVDKPNQVVQLNLSLFPTGHVQESNPWMPTEQEKL